MTTTKSGDKVSIHYTGTLTNGTVFDSSTGRDPLAFTIGSGQIIPGLDKSLPGMKVGDKKKVTIAPGDAYGDHHPDGVIEAPRKEMPEGLIPEVGLQLEMRNPDGQAMPVTITAVTDETVTLDANHRLAGETLIFDFELIAIDEAD